MHSFLKNIIFILSILFLFACEKVIDFEGRRPTPLLVLNSIVEADSTISVNLTKSKFFLDSGYDLPIVENGTIIVFVNDVLKDTLVYQGDGVYISKLKVKENDLVKIEAQAPGLNPVKSETKVQPIVQILSVDTVWEPLPESLWPKGLDTSVYNYQNEKIGSKIPGIMSVFVHFRDNDPEQNYFRLALESYENYYQVDSSGSHTSKQNFYSHGMFRYDDVVFGNVTDQALQGYTDSRPQNNLFSDELFNQKEYTLRFGVAVQRVTYFKLPETPYSMNLSFEINLQNLSKDYYFYKKSIQTSQNANQNFSEPVQIYNNIEGGIGIFGSISNSIREIKLDKYRSDMYY